jgi:glutamine amidotransferase
MCRLLGAAASVPIDLSAELLESGNSLLSQSTEHDSGWGIAGYENGSPTVERFAVAAHSAREFEVASRTRSRLLIVHVRRATLGGLTLANTHPFSRGRFSFCHNGTISNAAELERLSGIEAKGETDSERYFNLLVANMEEQDVVGSIRRTAETLCDISRFSGLNFLFCDGQRLYAYQLGRYTLLFQTRDLPGGGHATLVSSEALDDAARWTELEQDQLLICDPDDAGNPTTTRLLGERAAQIEFAPLDPVGMRGDVRGEWAAQRAAEGY